MDALGFKCHDCAKRKSELILGMINPLPTYKPTGTFDKLNSICLGTWPKTGGGFYENGTVLSGEGVPDPPPQPRGGDRGYPPPSLSFCGGIIKRVYFAARSAANIFLSPNWKINLEKFREIVFDCRPPDLGLISTKLNHPGAFFQLSVQNAE